MPPRKKSGKKGSVKTKKEETRKDGDVGMDMTDDSVQKGVKADTEGTEMKERVDPKVAIRADIKSTIMLTLQAVESKELAIFTQVTRKLNAIRKKLTPGVLQWAIQNYCPELQKYLAVYEKELQIEEEEDKKLTAELAEIAASKKRAEEAKKAAAKAAEIEAIAKEVAVMGDVKKKKPSEEEEKAAKEKEDKAKKEAEKEAEKHKQRLLEEAKKERVASHLPETRVLLHLLVTALAIDKGTGESASVTDDLLQYLHTFNRRTMDALSAKVYYFYTLTQERLGNLGTIRNDLLRYHRTATLQHNEPAQAALVVCILRSFLAFKLFEQADKFRLNTTLPETRSNEQYARYLYYIGQINAVQLQYSDAFNHLTQAVRKAPQQAALGFRQAANKLLVIVQLLMGEIPDRSLFIQGDLAPSLAPYFLMTKAVRVGDLSAFERVAEEHASVWAQDGLTTLIGRLRNNVIKTGLRKLNLSYSRIALSDIQVKLNLGSVQDAEFVVSKCIHDGVVDAVLDYDNKFMYSKQQQDKYATHNPQAMLHKRVMFCMEIHNDAVKALRFPKDAHKPLADVAPEDEDLELEADSMDDD